MRRRLDLAAALVHRPPVLFLDEPTTGLDPSSRSDLWAVIGELVAEGTTVLLTTQYLEEADRLADDIVVIDHGQVIAEGTAAELKAEHGRHDRRGRPARAEASTRAASSGILQTVGPSNIDGTTVEVKVDGRRPRRARGRPHPRRATASTPTRLTVREPTLDDVFLTLTGHQADEPEAADGQSHPERARRSRCRMTAVHVPRRQRPDRAPVRLGGERHAGHRRPQPHSPSYRLPQLLVFSTIQPVIFVLLFSYVFGGAIHIPGSPCPTSTT